MPARVLLPERVVAGSRDRKRSRSERAGGGYAASSGTRVAGETAVVRGNDPLADFLDCGVLARGFARWHCGCGFERLVALSCKGRGFCASCGGKRMTGLAADLTERVIPFVPVRQFVLSVPHRLRYLLAYDHERCIAVLRIFIRALLSFYRMRARKRGAGCGRTGSVTFLQRFGSSANLHVHAHVIVLDGVFTEAANGPTVVSTGPATDRS